VIAGTGRVLITAGILLLLFVAYQLWGTGIYQARAQNDLRGEFRRAVVDTPTVSSSRPGPSSTAAGPTPGVTTTTQPPTPTTLAPFVPPREGEAVALIRIPAIGVSQVVVEGVDVADLRKGPGRYPTTSLPGQAGNAAIAGHRTTYGAPFSNLDQLTPGDEIIVQTAQGTFRYEVDARGPFVVDPDDVSVLDSVPDLARPGTQRATLTLTTCHPKYSASQRLVVRADLVLQPDEEPLPPSPHTHGRRPTTVGGLGGHESSRTPTVIWGLVVAAVGALWWYLFHRFRHWYVWFAGAVPFLAVLFFFYVYLERLLPSSY
jgi:sortase A